MRSERLELVFEYTHSSSPENAVWEEFELLYKPGLNNYTGVFMGPYFDRLSFKLNAATGGGAKLEKNLWLASLTRNLLNKNRDLLRVLSPLNLQKVKIMPKFVRTNFYRLKYIPKTGDMSKTGMFARENLSEYLKPMTISSQELSDLLTKANIKSNREKVTFKSLHTFLNTIRTYTENLAGHVFVISVLVAAFLVSFVKRM